MTEQTDRQTRRETETERQTDRTGQTKRQTDRQRHSPPPHPLKSYKSDAGATFLLTRANCLVSYYLHF